LNFPNNTDYKTFAEGQDNIAPFELIPWILGQCRSVQQAKKRLEDAGLNFEIAGSGHTGTDGAYAFKQSIPAGTEAEPATVISVEFRHASSD